MTISNSFNLHKKINCVFPFFKSKLLCKFGIHNYILFPICEYHPIIQKFFEPDAVIQKSNVIGYETERKLIWKCKCCRKEEKFEEE